MLNIKTKTVTIKIGNDSLILETGWMAKQANGSVLAKYGQTMVLATVCCSSRILSDADFVPLSVDYNEKYYAAGKIPGGFLKRETRPKDKEILVSRLIDRPMRPLFNKRFGREIQIIPTTISTDQNNQPDIVGMNAAFACVYISDIPFDGPLGAVRIGFREGNFFINPTFDEMKSMELDLVVAGSEEGITMVEGSAQELPEEILLKAIEKAHEIIQQICQAQRDLAKIAGKEKLSLAIEEESEFEGIRELQQFGHPLLKKAWFSEGKHERSLAVSEAKNQIREHLNHVITEENEGLFVRALDALERDIVRFSIIKEKMRIDGRTPEDIRSITCETTLLPRAHGSALFTRGETQALAVTTLGTAEDEQIMDDIDGDKRVNFMLHYNFPPYSVGEVGRMATGRREIGHGHLAQRAFDAVLPTKEEFPYTMRLVSEVLESNGSSSMATVCGGSLSLMDAGVPLKSPVAGIAMGLVTDGSDFVVLSDISGEEDHLGDMDFKVAGTEKGITGFQMDIKVSNISQSVMKKALEQAKKGRQHILKVMNEVLDHSRKYLSDYAPRVIQFKVQPDKIGMIIGTGGKNIRVISESNNCKINVSPEGHVIVYSADRSGADLAVSQIQALIEDPEKGKSYKGIVKKIMDFGAFIEFMPGRDGLCHISKISDKRVDRVEDVLKEGQEVAVKLLDIDRSGRYSLSMIDV